MERRGLPRGGPVPMEFPKGEPEGIVRGFPGKIVGDIFFIPFFIGKSWNSMGHKWDMAAKANCCVSFL